MIIDIHTHVFPDDLAPRAMEVLVGNSRITPFSDGTLAGLRASMRGGGIDRSVIAPIATKPNHARGINRWAAMINQNFSDVLCFGTLHPAQDDWRLEIDQLAEDGIIGIKMHPDYQGFFVDEPELTPIYQALADAGIMLLFHAGVDVGLPPPVHCTPDRLARVLDAVPNLTVIAAHMGGYKCWDDVERYLMGRDLYLDTCYTIPDLGAERTKALAISHGIDRVLFGTDSPWTEQAVEVRSIRALGLSEDECAAVLGGNAERLLNR